VVIWHETALERTGTVTLIAEEGEGCRLCNWICSFSECYAFLRSRRLSLALAAARGVLLAPGLLPRISGNTRRLSRSAVCSARSEVGAELASICVFPTGSGRGLGKALVTEFIRRVRASAVEYAYLTTDTVDNDKVSGFYCGSGLHAATPSLLRADGS